MQHTFDPEIATKYGVNEAVLLQFIHFWIEHNKANEVHYNDGHYWMYNSVKAFGKQFPYMSPHVIRGALKKLEDEGLILTGNYNVTGYDRTTWYTLTQIGENVINHVSNTDLTGQTDIVTPGNPFTGADERPKVETVESYMTNNLLKMSPGNMQEFEECYNGVVTKELIKWAVDEACANGKNSWSYVRRILESMIEKGMKTVEDANAAKEENRREREYNREREQKTNGDLRLLNARFVR